MCDTEHKNWQENRLIKLYNKSPSMAGIYYIIQIYCISFILEASSFPKSVRFKVGNITVPHPDKEVSIDM